ncbi:MAG TPA: hypothetical protein VN784_10640 [Candidatus Limnocylindrales bacterium]|nr:hypothetical protein [Candidatus Limnocylindrales bacterium]
MAARRFPGLFASGDALIRKRVSGQKGNLFCRSFKCMFIVCVVAADRGAKLIDDKVPGIARLAAESLAFLHPAIALNSKRNSGQKVNLKSDYYNSPPRFKHSFGSSIRFFPGQLVCR